MDFQRDITIDLPFEQAVLRVREALAEQGFGIITEIDLQATFEAKIGAHIEPYRILGACHPKLAHQAIQIDPRVGVLLPCNVTIRTENEHTHIAIMIPQVMTAFEGTQALAAVADEAAKHLDKALSRVASNTEK